MRVPRAKANTAMEVKMTPMIDVVFLLLIFFVWTSSFELPEFDLPSALAEPPPGGAESNAEVAAPIEVFDEIVIRLLVKDAVLMIQLNGKNIEDTDALESRLRAILELGVQPPVIIDPADLVTMDRAVEVYDIARLAGADRVLFAARAEDDLADASP